MTREGNFMLEEYLQRISREIWDEGH